MFYPKFCPNPECSYHQLSNVKNQKTWYSKDGRYETTLYGSVQRFKCKKCKHRFSEQTFSMNYHAKKKVDYNAILEGIISTSSISDLSRKLEVSPHTIINRQRRMAVQSIAVHSHLLRYIKKTEPIVCDGFQSLVRNFYFPNNMNIAIGKNSQFFYCLTYAQIKRAGILSPTQKIKKDLYEERFHINPKEVEESFSLLIDSIIAIIQMIKGSTFILFTDKKQEYNRALEHNIRLQTFRKNQHFEHIRISSKEPRTINNPLFSVNYMDRQFRKDLSEHVVKSNCIGKNVNNQLERLIIYRFYHNYIKQYRVRQKHLSTHADMVGIPKNTVDSFLKKIFLEKLFISQISPLNSDLKIVNREYNTPLCAESAHPKTKNENHEAA